MARDLFEEAGIAHEGKSQGRDLFAEAGVKPEKTASNLWAPLDISAAIGSRLLTAPMGPASGYAGLAGTILPGKPGQGRDWTHGVQRAQEAMTYDPKTPAGEGFLNLLRYLPQKFSEWNKGNQQENYERNKDAKGLLSPEAGAAISEAVVEAAPSMLLPPVLSSGVNAVRNSSLGAKSRNSVKDATLQEAKDHGYVVPPSSTPGGNWFTDLLESLGGKAAIRQEATNRNQPVTNRIATSEAGLPENAALTPDALRQRANQLSGPYREARAIDPAVSQMVDELQTARADLSDFRTAYARERRPELRRQAEATQARVASLEQQIEAAASNAGIPGLAQRIRDARPPLAKVGDIEGALNKATGDVSARDIGALYRESGKLTGGLQTIGRAANSPVGRFMGDEWANPAPGVNNLRALAAPMMGMEGAAHGAGGILAGGLPLIGGPVRSLMLSSPVQAAFARPPLYLGSRLPQVSDPYLRAILMSTIPQDGALYQQ